jgi:hypothetical protein
MFFGLYATFLMAKVKGLFIHLRVNPIPEKVQLRILPPQNGDLWPII